VTAALVGGSAFIGLLIGSFLNVVAYRVPAGISVLRPPSSCPSCKHEIRPRDNVPVIGWILLRGRCRDCGAPISVRYPLVEAATAGLFAATAAIVGASWTLPAYLWFVGITVVLVLTDLDLKRIPNAILYPGTIVALVLLAAGSIVDGDLDALWRGIGGGSAYFILLLVIALLARGGFGFGDVKLAFVLGLFAAHRSWESLPVAVFAAFMVGGIVSIGLLIARRAGRGDAIPFGPSLVLGAYLAIAWGDGIADWYLGSP
jgi:leader peptidase (prepilin peptidase)/N-methyltransferase